MTWQLAKEVTGFHTKTGQQIGDIDGCSSDQDKVNQFNDFYIYIAPKLAKAVPPATTYYKSYLPNIDRDLIPPMSFKPVYFNQVERIINIMMNKVSYSLDNLSNKALKAISKQISLPMSHLINVSMSLSHIPQSWKTAKIVPLFKSGDSTKTTNYRPISLLTYMDLG
jgi:hypothetical protein